MVKYASMKERMNAFVIDIIFVSGLSFILGLLCSLINLIIVYLNYSFFQNWFCIVPSLIIIWLYFAGMESSKNQATLGKMLFGLKVTSLNYKRISFSQATKRFFFKIFSFGITLNHKGQALHDKLSKCLVIKE
ncbi:MAG: RDD family protein [Candidatus Nanoarchaeia archaeon]|jgi:uncharacterized RDD family membrane protein YckC